MYCNYYEFLQQYFGDYAYDFTIHAHLHRVDQVRNHGPLQFVFQAKYITKYSKHFNFYVLLNLYHKFKSALGDMNSRGIY